MISAMENSTFGRMSEDEKRRAREVMMILLKNGADMNMQNTTNEYYLGKTALHIACVSSPYSLVKLLLEHGADPYIRDSNNNTPLLIASQQDKYVNMEALLEFGVEVNVKDKIILRVLSYSFTNFGLNHRYATLGVKLLLDYGADVDVKYGNGMTALIWIVQKYWEETNVSLDLIQLLLDEHADVNAQLTGNSVGNCNGDTALHIAVRKGKIKFVSMILKYHPNLSIRNQDNDTVLDIANKCKSSEIIYLIENEFRNQIYKCLLRRLVLSKSLFGF